jgi:DNA (cytosine-5)-methyltransferase 1
MKKKLLSLFSGCGGMDIGFEGGFKVPKQIINNKSHSYIDKENKKDIVLKKNIF